MKTHLLRFAAALGVVCVLAAPSLAAPKPHGSPSPTALTGSVSGDSYSVTGSGFQPGEWLVLNLGEASGCCSSVNVVADASGSFTWSGEFGATGTYSVKAAEMVKGKWTFVAGWSYDYY